MKRALFIVVFALTETGKAIAEHLDHHHDHDGAILGHHWAIPSYTHEIQLQLAIITAALAAAGIWSVLSSIRRKRKCVD